MAKSINDYYGVEIEYTEDKSNVKKDFLPIVLNETVEMDVKFEQSENGVILMPLIYNDWNFVLFKRKIENAYFYKLYFRKDLNKQQYNMFLNKLYKELDSFFIKYLIDIFKLNEEEFYELLI